MPRVRGLLRPLASLVPLRVTPQPRPANRIVFVSRFLRNPLLVIPRSAYEEDVVPYDRGSVPFAWVTEPGLIKSILLDEHEKFGKRVQIQMLGPLLGNGILTSEGPEWKWQRQTSAPDVPPPGARELRSDFRARRAPGRRALASRRLRRAPPDRAGHDEGHVRRDLRDAVAVG